MSKLTGFLQLRRGIFEHVRDGRMSHMDALALIYMASQADTRTGVWNGSAGALAGELALSSRNARKSLERLTHARYIKRFAVPGRHVCYPILVNKFLVTDGEHKGQLLNAFESTSPTDLRYVPSEPECDLRGEHCAPQKRIENREQRRNKKNAAKTAPPVDPRHKAVFDGCYKAYNARFGQSPTWGGKEAKTLSRFLVEHPSISPEEINRRYGHFLASTERYHAEKHGTLSHLLSGSNFDVFADGPITAIELKGGKPNGRPTATDLAIQNARALGLD